jgi:hypothetical protein
VGLFKPIQKEKIMNKLFKTLSFVAAIAFLATACIPPVVEAAKAAPAEVTYQAVLGKSLNDQTVAEFIASNNCTQAGPFHLCRPAGVAFGSNEDNVVKTAYLYVSAAEGFSAYRGELPMTLEASDTMADVERKLAQIRVPRLLKGGFDLGSHSLLGDLRTLWRDRDLQHTLRQQQECHHPRHPRRIMQPEIKVRQSLSKSGDCFAAFKKQMSGGSAKAPPGPGSSSRPHSGEVRRA